MARAKCVKDYANCSRSPFPLGSCSDRGVRVEISLL